MEAKPIGYLSIPCGLASPQATVRQSPQAVVQLALRPPLCWNMHAVALNALIMKRKSNLVVSITAPRGCLLY